jgi:hypothetical protein
MFAEDFVMSDRPTDATLYHARDELRATLANLFDPAAAKPRLVARLEHLSYQQLRDQLARAALRDSVTLAQVETALCPLDTPPWSDLAEALVREIALHLQGGRALAWCATCRAFRAAQPPLRILSISTCRSSEDDYSGYISQLTVARATEHAHRFINLISPRHASELTRLTMDIHLDSPHEWSKYDQPWSVHLSALQELEVMHGERGWTGGHFDPFAQRTCELIRSVAPSLRSLGISACTQFKPEQISTVLPYLGSLAHLALDLTPVNMLGGPSGAPADTLRLQALVRQHCVSLQTAYVLCHSRGTERHRRMMAEYAAEHGFEDEEEEEDVAAQMLPAP